MRSKSSKLLIAFGSCHLGKSILWAAEDFLTLYVLLVVLKIPTASAGAMFFLSMLWNAAFDGVWGQMLASSSHLRRAAPWIAAISVPVTCLSFALLPFTGGSPIGAGVALVLFRTGFSLFDVPHNAMASWLVGDVGHLNVSRLRNFGSGGASLAVGLATLPLLSAAGSAVPVAQILLAVLGGGAFLLMLPMPWLLGQMKTNPYQTPEPTPVIAGRRSGILRFCLVQMAGAVALAAIGRAVLHVQAISLLAGLGPCLMLAMRLAGTGLWSPVAKRFSGPASLSLSYGFAALSMAALPVLIAVGSWSALIAFALFGLALGAIGLAVWSRFSELCANTQAANATASSYGLFTGTSKVALGVSGALTAAWLETSSRTTGINPLHLWPLALGGAAVCLIIAALERPTARTSAGSRDNAGTALAPVIVAPD